MSMFTDMIMKKRRSSSSGHPEMEITTAGQFISNTGWKHIKGYDGLAIAAMIITTRNYTSPLILSTAQESAAVRASWRTSFDRGILLPTLTVAYNNELYYCYLGDADPMQDSFRNNPAVTTLSFINDFTGVSEYSNFQTAAKDILDYYYRVI